MNSKLLLVGLGWAALVLMSPQSVLAMPGDPIAFIPVGLEGDPGSVVVATTKTDANGKFEFMGVKAGKYRLVVQAAEGAGKQTTVESGAALELQRVFRITNVRANATIRAEGLTELVGDVLLLRVDPKTGRSLQTFTLTMDGGTIGGTFKIADNESPLPQDRQAITGVATPPSDPNAKSDPGLEQTVRAPLLVLTPGDNVNIQVRESPSFSDGGKEPTKKHNYIGVVTLVKGIVPAPLGGGSPTANAVEYGLITEKVAGVRLAAPIGVPTTKGKVTIVVQGPDGKVLPRAVVRFKNESGETTTGTADAAGCVLWAPDPGTYAMAVWEVVNTNPMDTSGVVAAPADPNASRYRQLPNGEWLYYGLDNKWLVHRNGVWVAAGDLNGDGIIVGAGAGGGPNIQANPNPQSTPTGRVTPIAVDPSDPSGNRNASVAATGTLIPKIEISVGGVPGSIPAPTTPSVYGQSVTFTATVNWGDGTTTPTGTVTFYDGVTLLGTAKLTKGSGSLTIPSLTAGNHSISATYSGDANFAAGSCKAVTFTVTAQPTVANTYSGTITIFHEGIPVGTTQTDAAGKFEFKNLKAGKYQLGVLPSGSTPTLTKVGQGTLVLSTDSSIGTDPAGKQTAVVDGAQLQQTFTITVTSVNDAPTISLSVDPKTGRTLQTISVEMDGGTISGAFKIADNESPRPQDRVFQTYTYILGKFVVFKNGNLTLLVSPMEGEEPMLTEFGKVTTIAVDPMDPMGVNTLPAEEAFKNLKVGTPVKVKTNTEGQTAFSIERTFLDGNPSFDNVAAPADPNAWRYKQQNGEWWYYGTDEKWLVHRNGKWIPYTATVTPGSNGAGLPTGGIAVGDLNGDGIPDNVARPGNQLDRLGGLILNGTGINGTGKGTPGTASPGTGSPRTGSPLGGFLPGRAAPAGPSGGGVRGAFGGKK